MASAASVDTATLPVVGVRRDDGAAVLELAAGAAPVIAAFGATAPLDGTLPPAAGGIAGADLTNDPGLAPC